MHHDVMTSRWQQQSDAPLGADYDAHWKTLAESGKNIHGEADLVESLLSGPDRSILDAGCGTGRVAIELARRGHRVWGVDSDPRMLTTALAKAPELSWLQADLADLPEGLPAAFDVVLLAGNVMIFLTPGTEGQVVEALAGRLQPGGLLVAGFSLRPDHLTLEQYDRLTESAGLRLVHRWSTWDREPYAGGDYAVSVHAR